MAILDLLDKPSFVNYGYSVPLDDFEVGERGKRKAPAAPLKRWREKVESFRTEMQQQEREGIWLVHICPLNLNQNHFTLLEINERERKIFHYNSMASRSISNGAVELSRVGKMVQVGSRLR